jgi:hypothetical protein
VNNFNTGIEIGIPRLIIGANLIRVPCGIERRMKQSASLLD